MRRLKSFVRRLSNGLGKEAGAVRVEETFWDFYVGHWESSAALNKAQFVGEEWGHEADFVALLEKYGDREKAALEIGCGGGRITSVGARIFRHVHAADLSAQMLRKAQEAIRASNVGFHKLDGFTLKEFADGRLDFVYSHDVFVQLSSVQVYTYLLEIERVLKTGGVGLVSFYDFVDRFDMFRETSVKVTAARNGSGARRLHFVTEQMVRTMLAETRLVPMEIQHGRFLTAVFCKSEGTDVETRSAAFADT